MISLPPSPSHPVLTALSSGREENILMKPLLSSYRFDPRVVSNLHVGQLEDGAVGFFLFFPPAPPSFLIESCNQLCHE